MWVRVPAAARNYVAFASPQLRKNVEPTELNILIQMIKSKLRGLWADKTRLTFTGKQAEGAAKYLCHPLMLPEARNKESCEKASSSSSQPGPFLLSSPGTPDRE
ncbi:hypothetical protein NDU88_007660 [Pleurodeles waltl]|uniref:Uncharacterized protein n=1 Tax=Pleurodeles waltl TaxID=8319 RepID=A0AAV7PQV6_PLEWA|nr:hypothetical protein NDU88_007660 [Pleurodeles waltl]